MMFGLVAVAGVRLLVSAGLGQREGVIVTLSLGMGLGLPTQPALLASLAGWLHSLVESGISAVGLTALLLNLLWLGWFDVRPETPSGGRVPPSFTGLRLMLGHWKMPRDR